MSRVSKLPYLDTALQSEQPAPLPAVAPAANPSPQAAGASLSSAGHAILGARFSLEQWVGGARENIRFHEKSRPTEYVIRELAFNRTLLTDKIAELAAFDLTRLTDECRARLTLLGKPFTAPQQIAAE